MHPQVNNANEKKEPQTFFLQNLTLMIHNSRLSHTQSKILINQTIKGVLTLGGGVKW